MHHAAVLTFSHEAGAHAAPFLYAHERDFAEQVVSRALRRANGVEDDELLAAYRAILTARASALLPAQKLNIESAARLKPADALDPDAALIPSAWFGQQAASKAVNAGSEASAEDKDADLPDPDWFAVTARVMEVQRDDAVMETQVRHTRQSAELFATITGVKDVRQIRQHHLARFVDTMRKLPKTYGRIPKERAGPCAVSSDDGSDLSVAGFSADRGALDRDRAERSEGRLAGDD